MPQWIGQPGQLPQPPLDNDVGLFATEYEALFTNEISGASKDRLIRVMSEKVIPYRARDGWRLFPPVSFYELLLQNEWDRDEILPIAVRCAKWFLSQTVQQADVRIAEVEDLLKRHTAPIQPPAEAPEPLRKTKSSRKRKMTAHQGQNPMIAAELDKSPTMAYRKIIGSKDQFARLKEEYVRHIRHEEANDMEHIDPTWPSTEATDCQYVRQAVEAIYDTSNFIEKAAALEKKARIDDESSEAPNKKRKVGMEAASGMKQTKLNPTDTILANPNSSPRAQLKAVIRHELKDIDVEMLSAKENQKGYTMKGPSCGQAAHTWERYATFAQRWDQVCLNFRTSKQLVNSTLQAAWHARNTSTPAAELKTKQGNRVLNAKRDRESWLGRQILSRAQEGATLPDTE
ncbi:hypothetical protein KHU50_009406 [Colletotrichum sp. SAR 10_65]|nr:hypothetical protein KHU50_009406 [Colletotrichum sp. SAR 10_65]